MLQFITHQTPRFGIIEGAVAALNGGCKWIQLRMKGAPIEAVRQTAQQLIPLCKEHEAILVLDDYAQLAADLDIDGVHLGKLRHACFRSSSAYRREIHYRRNGEYL